MSDRENVISGLQYTVEMFLFDPATGYSKDPDDLNAADRITYDACIGAIALLKEQEPILLENQHKPYGFSTNANSPWISRCPRCGKKVEGKQTRFCKYCGRAVKWDE